MESMTTLTGLLRKAASAFPSRRAISVSGRFDLTHSRLQELVDQAASLLVSSGVNPGDVVALTFPNSVEVCSFFFFFFLKIFCLVAEKICRYEK